MQRPLLVIEDLESARRYRLAKILGVTWWITWLGWLLPLMLVVLGTMVGAVSGRAVVAGIFYGLSFYLVFMLHNLGHMVSSRLAGAPVAVIVGTATRFLTLYDDEDEHSLPSKVHAMRAIGGSMLNIFAGLIALGIGGTFGLRLFGYANILFAVVSLLPLGDFDGAVLFREYRKKRMADANRTVLQTSYGLVEEIIPGLYMTGLGGNIFLLDGGDDGIIVIDTGLPGAVGRILSRVKALGRGPGDVRHILITHADIDHIGSLGALARETGATIYASELSARYIETAMTPPHVPAAIALITQAFQRRLLRQEQVDIVVQDGDVLSLAGGIRVIAIPGHTPDNIAYFWDRERVLICPDLLSTSGGRLSLFARFMMHNVEQARRSIRKALAFDPLVVCVGHGPAFHVQDAPGEIDALLDDL